MDNYETYRVVYPRNLLILAAFVWTIVIAASLGLNIASEQTQSLDQAKLAARSYFFKDFSFRLWATGHGGVYVPITEHTPPNPYLDHVEERDVTTPSGKKLTLMNPAYILREVMVDFSNTYGVQGKITSLKVMNPINEPDAWERKTLATFTTGDEEVTQRQIVEGVEYLRYMKPMETQKGCLKCHGEQGYKEGDIRGGVSLSVPLKPFFDQQDSDIRLHIVTHSVIWLAGLFGLFMFWRQLLRFLISRSKGEAERERLITGIEQSADGVIITDVNGVISYVNPAFETMTGYEKTEVIGATPRILKSGEHGREFYRDMWNTLLSGRTWKGGLTNRRKDGTFFTDQTTISPTFDKKGTIVNFVAVKRDVSDEQRLQKARDYFTAVTSHELRTPLSKIQLLLLMMGRQSGDANDKMMQVTESIYDHLDWMMRQTETISEINLGWRTRVYDNYFLFLTVNECVERARRGIARQGRTVEIAFIANEAIRETMVKGNEKMIASAIDNLLSNGVKYTPDGKNVHLFLSTEQRVVTITIRDEGEGMSQIDREDASLPYYSNEKIVNHSTGAFRYRGGGLGLGLSLVKMVMEYHGGELSIEGLGEGQGTSATLSFPVDPEGVSNG